MKLLLIRHGQSYGDILNLHEGRADYSLTEAGFKQANDLAQYLYQHYQIDKIFCSPLKRAFSTAKVISDKFGLELINDDRLMEYDNGLLAGISHEYQKQKYPLDEDNDINPKYQMESIQELKDRVNLFFQELCQTTNKDQTIAIVSHGGTLKELFTIITNKEFNKPLWDTSITEIEIQNKEFKILIENSNKHLLEETIMFSRRLLNLKVAYFAGGCFWCMTPMFKIYKAEYVLCGYSGGDEVNPQYLDVKKQKTGHREAMAVIYDPTLVSYEKLLEIYLSNVDPFDKEGQFIDKGHSYTLAIYYEDNKTKETIINRINRLKSESDRQVYIDVEKLKNFYEAEEYHQDYYLKNPEAFEKELVESGRKK